jgi:hypothetical protein
MACGTSSLTLPFLFCRNTRRSCSACRPVSSALLRRRSSALLFFVSFFFVFLCFLCFAPPQVQSAFRNEKLIFSRELLLPNLKLFFGIGAAYLKIIQFCLYWKCAAVFDWNYYLEHVLSLSPPPPPPPPIPISLGFDGNCCHRCTS